MATIKRTYPFHMVELNAVQTPDFPHVRVALLRSLPLTKLTTRRRMRPYLEPVGAYTSSIQGIVKVTPCLTTPTLYGS